MQASAIVLAHGGEPHLAACVRALLAAAPREVLVVDNEAAPERIAEVAGLPGVRVLRPGANLGYAGGCNHAAAHASGDVLVFVNSDAVVQPGALAALVHRVADRSIGLANGGIRLADDPDRVNSVGNPVHFLMFSWAGSLGARAAEHQELTEVASMSGVAFAVRRALWDQLGGFDPAYFAYCEDVDLSLRTWQAGYRVVHEPAAVVLHHYEFGRNAAKHYLLERNRLMNLLLLPESRTQRLVAAPALAVELGVLVVALRDGWAADKVAGWRWLVAHRRELAARRRAIQAARVVDDAELAPRLRGPLDPPPGLGPAVPGIVSRGLASYWRWALRRISGPATAPGDRRRAVAARARTGTGAASPRQPGPPLAHGGAQGATPAPARAALSHPATA
ncbi:MAG TPA: glycosyltransferase family 2 protein [Candidatus Nanopelagicales bacterium]